MTPGSNGPYWSLGFEVPYYLAFGIALFTTGRLRAALLIGWAVLFGPKIAAYFPLWLLGVATFDILARRDPKPRPLLGLALLATSLVAYGVIKFGGLHLPFYRIYHPLQATDIIGGAVYYTFIGLLAAMSIAGFDLLTKAMRSPPAWMSNTIVWLAGGSFTLYLVHLPLLNAARALVPSVRDQRLTSIAVLLVVLIVTYALAECAERRKRAARELVARFI